jgi:hypothetical protein
MYYLLDFLKWKIKLHFNFLLPPSSQFYTHTRGEGEEGEREEREREREGERERERDQYFQPFQYRHFLIKGVFSINIYR